MAESFIGMTISVTLHNPPGAAVMGRVNNVIAGQTLSLEQVFFPGSGNHAPAFNVAASNIADLQVVDTNSTRTPHAAPPPPLPPSQPMNVAAPRDLPIRQPTVESPSVVRQTFVDPAILSFGKSPAPAARAPPPEEPPMTPTKSMMAAAAAKLPTNSSPFVGVAPEKKTVSTKAAKKQLQEEAADVDVEEKGEPDEAQTFDAAQSANTGKKTRRGRRGPKSLTPVVTAATEAQTVKEALSPNVSRNGLDMNATPGNNNRKGWRSTPLLKEPSATPTSTKGKKIAKSQRAQVVSSEMQNGWATEDATDIQDLGDFDFEANLNKFDKRTVFDQIRNEDTTADEDRLVSHNRLPPTRPGTYGGKNLHPTENVLSPPLKPKYQSSELASTSDADTELNLGSGQNSRRAMSRTSNKRPARTSNSGLVEGENPLTTAVNSNALNRSMSSLRGGSIYTPSSVAASSPNPHRTRSPLSVSSPLHSLDQLNLTLRQQPHFRTSNSKQACSIFQPERLRQVEVEAVSNIGISADAITESAARSIADPVISSAIRPGASRRNSKQANTAIPNSSSKPVVVILAGNHIVGARAIASARYLYSRGLKVLISVLDFSNPSIWHQQLVRQIHSLQALGRQAARIEGWRSTLAYIKRLDGPPAIIIDALLDGQRHTDSKSVEQQLESRDMIDWANRSRAGVVSLNIPSGFSGSDGSTAVVEGEPLAIRPRQVLVLGAPMTGLLEAVREGEGADWTISIVDIGINVALADRERIAFGSEWSTGLKFFGGDAV